MRLDVYLTENKYCESRNKSSELISGGYVSVNGATVKKPSYTVKDGDTVSVQSGHDSYVARSAKKLATAKVCFSLCFSGKTAVDLGASTGGFCQIMLENGIKKIYAVDIGTNQLHKSIRADYRVVSMENTNARYITRDMFKEEIDLVTSDLSFISLGCILPAAYAVLREGGELVCLVKPQFEVGPSNIGKNGVVRDVKLHIVAVKNVVQLAYGLGFNVKNVCFSGLAGESGNREYLLYMVKEAATERLSDTFIEGRIRGTL